MTDFDKRYAGLFGLGIRQGNDGNQEIAGLARLFETATNDSVRRRASWNDRFSHWEKAESTTETTAIERGRTTVQDILSKNSWLASQAVRIAPQGSFTNRTNVRNEADIDLRVQHPLLRVEYEPGVDMGTAWTTFGYSDAGRSYAQLAAEMRSAIVADLRYHLGKENVDDTGKKAVRVKGVTGSRGEVDVVPCFTLHHVYVPASGWAYDRVEGIAILGTDLSWTFNYPDQHIANGKLKRTMTGHQFKRIVRIIKRMQSDMIAHGVATERVPSFLVECLVYLVEDHHFLGNEDRYGRVKRILDRSLEIVCQDAAALYNLPEVNGIKPLFSAQQGWTVENARTFLARAISHMGDC